MNDHNMHGCQDDPKPLVFRQNGQSRRRYVGLAVVGLACAGSFSLGFWISERVQTKRDWQRFMEILQAGVDMGKVDEGWALEVEIINHEADYGI
jgi:hypothetical protein